VEGVEQGSVSGAATQQQQQQQQSTASPQQMQAQALIAVMSKNA
jgi:hypothetical protein